MIEESFSRGNSLLHRWQSEFKLPIALGFMIIISSSSNLTTIWLEFLFGLFFLFGTGLPFGLLAKRIFLVNGFTVFLWLTLPFTYGESKNWFTISNEGIQIAWVFTLRTNAALFFLISLLGTSSITQLGFAFKHWKIPDKFGYLFLFSYRYLFLINGEFNRLKRSAQIRGFVPGTNTHTYKTLAYLMGMTMVKSWNRSQRIEQAMILRGFNGKLPAKSGIQIKKTDLFLSIGSLILFILLIIIEWELTNG